MNSYKYEYFSRSVTFQLIGLGHNIPLYVAAVYPMRENNENDDYIAFRSV